MKHNFNYFRHIFSLVVLVHLSLFTTAKQDSASHRPTYRNSITLSLANFSIIGLTDFDPNSIIPPTTVPYIANQFGITATHEVFPRIAVSIAYNAWNANSWLNRHDDYVDEDHDHTFDHRYQPGQRNNEEPGALRFRYAYKMIDVAAVYTYDRFKRHHFSVGAGLSYTWGTNFYVYSKQFNVHNNFEEYIMRTKKEGYAGLLIPVSYDFLFFKERMRMGIQANARKYFGLYSFQIDYGLHVGLNF